MRKIKCLEQFWPQLSGKQDLGEYEEHAGAFGNAQTVTGGSVKFGTFCRSQLASSKPRLGC